MTKIRWWYKKFWYLIQTNYCKPRWDYKK